MTPYPCTGSTTIAFNPPAGMSFALIFIPWASLVLTLYQDGATSPVYLDEGDYEHAALISRVTPLTPQKHKWVHECAHHLIGVACGEPYGSPVIRRSAERMLPAAQPQPAAENEERAVRALVHTTFTGDWKDYAPLETLRQRGVPLGILQWTLRDTLKLARHREHGSALILQPNLTLA